LRSGYRSNQEDFYKIRGINLEDFEKFAQKNYQSELVKKLKQKLKRTVNNVKELAAFVMWAKLADEYELRIDEYFNKVRDKCAELINSVPEPLISQLTQNERKILKDLREQLISNEPLRELARQLFAKGKLIHKEDDMLFVHAMFPVDESRNFLGLQCQHLTQGKVWEYWKNIESDFIKKSGTIFEDICKAYDQNRIDYALKYQNELWNSDLPDKLFQLSDSEYSPAFARKQTRAIHTFLEDKEEPENYAQKLIRENKDADFIDKLCNEFKVDKIIIGHISNKDGDIKVYKGTKKRCVISVDPFFALKRGSLTEKGGTESGKGAGLLVIGEYDKKDFVVIRIIPEIAERNILCERKTLQC
ncbi:MAG: fructose-bisphosphatase class III, partial [Methanosarcinales archaeon]